MRYLLLLVLAGCGSSVVVGADGEGGSSGSSTSSSGSGPCVPCGNTGLSDFSADRLCPGEELEKYEAMIACACREDTCGGPEGDCHEKSDAFVLLCDGGYVGSGCAGCLGDHCLEEFFACKGQEPP